MGYHTDAGDAWNLDLWFWPRAASAGNAADARALCQRLTPENRLAILWIKDALHEQPAYRSVDLYEAVLDHGVRTPAQFERYQRCRA